MRCVGIVGDVGCKFCNVAAGGGNGGCKVGA